MAELKHIVKFLNEYLENDKISDASYNGLQFEGKAQVNKILFAVDAGIETFKKAVELGADMIVVHHGHFWSKKDPSIVGFSKERFKILFDNDISLYASHLPLDKHKDVGNNAQLHKILKTDITEEFVEYNGQNISFIGKLDISKPLTEIQKVLNNELNTDCHVLPFGKPQVKTIGVCSGGGNSGMLIEAINKGVDLYITGEETEVFHVAKDAKINVIFAGHHATETVGVKALSKVVKNEIDVEVEFVDIPTGI